MTVIKYIDSTPHIVRFGSTNDSPAKSELQLWRNGKHFVIIADQTDVRGTEFERKWLPLLNPEPMTSLASRWSELCDLVISSCLEILQRLAPDTAYWSTLYDYLHVESYTLKLQSRASASASASGVDVDVVVHEGPTSDTCAYEMQPTAWNTFSIPNVLPIFESQRVIPLDHEQDLKGPPKKVQLPDGKVAFFVPCKASTRRFDSTTIMNESHRSIASILSLHSLSIPRNDTHARIPNVLGVLSDRWSSTAPNAQEETKIAGLFLEWIDGFRLINWGLYAGSSHASPFKYSKWEEEVTGLIEEVGRLSSSIGVIINPLSIIIDQSDGHTWVTEFSIHEVKKDNHDSVVDSKRSQIRLVFDQWLKGTEAAVSNLSAELDQQEIRKGAIGRWYAIVNSQP